MKVKLNGAGILGTGHCVPHNIVTNADMEKIVERQTNGSVRVRALSNGILHRRV